MHLVNHTNFIYLSRLINRFHQNRLNRMEQNGIEQNRTEQDEIEWNRTEQNRIEKNRDQSSVDKRRVEQIRVDSIKSSRIEQTKRKSNRNSDYIPLERKKIKILHLHKHNLVSLYGLLRQCVLHHYRASFVEPSQDSLIDSCGERDLSLRKYTFFDLMLLC